MNLRLLIFLCCVLSLSVSFGQEQIGLRLNAFSGISTVRLNPAAPATTPYRWEVSLAEGSAFLSNNYLFFRNARTRDLLNGELTDNILLAPDLSNPETMPPGHMVLDFYNDSRRRFAYSSVTIGGPSFYYKIDRYNSIGLTTGARFIGSVTGVDNDFSYYRFNQFRADELFEVSTAQMGLLGFSEIGLNYTLSAPAPEGTFNLGITAKFLQGYDALFFASKRDFDMARVVGNGLQGSAARFKYGFTDGLTAEDYRAEVRGAGIGFDIGMFVTVDGFEPGEYIWKIGFSILDIGEVRFQDAGERHTIRMTQRDSVTLFPDNYSNIKDQTDLQRLARSFSFDATGDSLQTLQDNSISMMLPSAVSLQVDHAITSNVFIGGLFHHYLPLGTDGIRRGSLLALAPRFENKWVSLNLPVSIYNWQQVRFGAAIRIGPFTVGTDHLGAWMSRKNLYGTDIYAAFTLFPFGRKGRKGSTGVDCYSF